MFACNVCKICILLGGAVASYEAQQETTRRQQDATGTQKGDGGLKKPGSVKFYGQLADLLEVMRNVAHETVFIGFLVAHASDKAVWAEKVRLSDSGPSPGERRESRAGHRCVRLRSLRFL